MKYLLRSFLAFAVSFSLFSATSAPRILTSIKPVNSIVASLTMGVTTPDILIRDKISAHSFQLRPNDLLKIEQSDLIVYIGNELEYFLPKAIASNSNTKVVNLLSLDGITKYKNRSLSCNHGDEHEHNIDPHAWLKVDNMLFLSDAVAKALVEIDPSNADIYKKNLTLLKEDLLKLKIEINELLKYKNHSRYIMMHDALQYFERDYHIKAAGVLITNHNFSPSAGKITELRQVIKEKEVSCILTEPQFSLKWLDLIDSENKIKTLEIDILGANLEIGPNMYRNMMLEIANIVSQC